FASTAKKLSRRRSFLLVLAKIVVGHEDETEPYGKKKTDYPRRDHAPDHPGRHAQDEWHSRGRLVVTEDIAGADTPDEDSSPKGHDKKRLTPGIAQQTLFLAVFFLTLSHS